MNVNPIRFEYEGKEYTLEFTRESVKQLERSGFDINNINSKLMTTIPQLFAGAFLAHHRFIKQDKIDEMFNKFTNKSALLERLADLYKAPFESLLEDEVDEKNGIQWE
jgi:hypothetical protein